MRKDGPIDHVGRESMSFWNKRIFAAVAVPAALLFTASVAQADHKWGEYHLKRDGVDPLPLTISDEHVPTSGNTLPAADCDALTFGCPDWGQIFDYVVNDTALDNDLAGWPSFQGSHLSISESSDSPNVRSFNDNYGESGWLGLATIWISRGKYKHITRGEVKVNDYYVTWDGPNGEGYDRFEDPSAWQHVWCQEAGHTFGLDHNRNGDTGGSPDDTCMNDAVAVLEYEAPNVHDREQVDLMYAHDHGSSGTDAKPKKCNPKHGCPSGAAVGHAVWAEHYETDEEMFDAADAVVDVTVLSSNFDRMVGRGQGATPVTRVVLRVEGTLSGFTRPVIVLEQTRGAGLELEDDPGYVTGDDYTLYLREIGHNTYRTVNPNGRIRN